MSYNIQLNYEMVDQIVVDQLSRCRTTWLGEIESIKNGGSSGIFNWNDEEADLAELHRHVEAIDMMLNWFATPEQLKEIYG
jgi:hypothetical protein